MNEPKTDIWPPPPKYPESNTENFSLDMSDVQSSFLVNESLDIGLGISLAVIVNLLITGIFMFIIAPHLPGYGRNFNPLGSINTPIYYEVWFVFSTLNFVIYRLIPSRLKSLMIAYGIAASVCLLACFFLVSTAHIRLR